MALKTFDLKLTDVAATVDAGATKFKSDSSDVNIVEGSSTVATAVTKDLASAKLDGFGTLNADTDKVVTFVADAALQSGAYTASHGNNASLKTFDASKASANLSLTTGLVSVDGGALKAGSGNDTILIADTVNTAPTGVKVFGGKGADLFVVKGDSAAIEIADYNYAEGDKISVATAPVMANFDTNGNMTVGTDSTVKGYGADGVYKFGVIDGNKKKYDYVAAVSNADVNFTAGTDNLVFQAKNGGSVTVDASKAASASINATVNADITLGGITTTENHVTVGAGAGSTAVVDLGYGKDSIEATAGTALTLKVGREDGVENSLKAALDSDDTLVLTTGKISDVSMVGTNKADLMFGATSVAGAFGSDTTGTFNVQFGSDEAKKLAYTSTDTKAVAYSKDVSYYLGAGKSAISMAAGSTDDVVLDMVNFTNGIASVDLTDVNKVNKKAAVDIIATGNASINATVAHSDVEWKFDLTAKDTADSPTYNVLDVAGAAGVDRIVLSDSAKGNQDSVKGFVAGEDILVLSDVDKLTEKTFTRGTANTDVVLQNSKASINGALAQGTDLDVVLADGTAKKVALAGAGTGTAGAVVATQKTTTVINQDTVDGIVKFDIKDATENNAAFVVDMTGTVSNAIDYLGKFTSIDATVGAADALIIGNEAITSIKATGSADHGAVVWAGAKANAQISLAPSASGATDAGNIVWTGALDGASSVAGFDDKDKLYVYGVDGLSKTAVADGFGINVEGAKRTLVYHTGASSMTFTTTNNTNAGKIDVMYMDSTAEGGYGYKKVAFDTADSGSVAFATDVDVYIGTGAAAVTVANDAVAEGQLVAINLSNKGAGSVEEGGAYYKGIHNVDASASAGTFLLIGDNSNGAKLTGGAKGNAIWGGGDASQTMTGGVGVADIFWFGSKDGHDVVTNFGTKDGADGDAVFLYDATSIDAIQITAEGKNAKVVFKDTNSTLTLDNISNIDDVKFMVNAAGGGYAYYKYDSKTSAFVQQKA